ncbi:FAD-dependent oxidoreductase domain-containing protein 2 isoform X2 [Octopus bimaculoides]|nr:FAD-dependent oxidoreductase domain-containing protein 2 isoform X2 [Octopus bimaculoides]XP_052823421.1 FAD-dependent oxidoreductase domain-containing protein 2 isoform X2 [Octopus bimaculoides]
MQLFPKRIFIQFGTIFALLVVNSLTKVDGQTQQASSHHDYCIIGAGPSGLQMGYFLEKSGRDYIIFERTNTSGNFFTKYPRHRTLISINKRNTGRTNKEFNMRHDWNSLLSDKEHLKLRYYSKEMFPHADVLVKYLSDFQRMNNLNVQFNTEVSNIQTVRNDSVKEKHTFTMSDQYNNIYACRWLIVATGLWKPNIPRFDGIELTQGYESISINPEDFEGKSVLILGRGNSAFETANAIYGATNVIHMVARSRVRLAWATHYVGDLRAVNNGVLDTYQLKSLDGIAEAFLSDETKLMSKNGKFQLVTDDEFFDNFAFRESYDVIIRCLGFTFDDELFYNTTEPKRGTGKLRKFPEISPVYESTNIPGMYFSGTITHSLDFRMSAGGFIHGFRYTARTLHRYLEWHNHGKEWPSVKLPVNDVLYYTIKRINEAAGIYQMFQVLIDVIILNEDHTEVTYVQEVPLKMLHKLPEVTGIPCKEIIAIVFQYGANFSGPGNDVFREDRANVNPEKADKSNFLHPVLYHYKNLPSEKQMLNLRSKELLPTPDDIHHMVEDFLTVWDTPNSHIFPLRRFLENVFNKDLRHFFSSTCAKFLLTLTSLPLFCEQYYMKGQGLTGSDLLLEMIEQQLAA